MKDIYDLHNHMYRLLRIELDDKISYNDWHNLRKRIIIGFDGLYDILNQKLKEK